MVGRECTPLAVPVEVSNSSGVPTAVCSLFTLACYMCYIFTSLKQSGTWSCPNKLLISKKQNPKQSHQPNDQWKNVYICSLFEMSNQVELVNTAGKKKKKLKLFVLCSVTIILILIFIYTIYWLLEHVCCGVPVHLSVY